MKKSSITEYGNKRWTEPLFIIKITYHRAKFFQEGLFTEVLYFGAEEQSHYKRCKSTKNQSNYCK